MTNYSGSVWIDDQPVLSNVPLKTDLDVQRSPEISLSGNPGIPVKVWIDDLDVKFLDRSMILQDSAEVVFRPLFRDNFNRYERALFPRQGGWMPGQDSVDGYGISQRKTAQEGGVVSEKATPEILMSGSTIDDAEYASSSKSFKLEDPDNEAGLVVKRFSLPVRTPFCVSAENFAISAVNQDSRGDDNRIGLSGREQVDEREDRRSKRPTNEKERLGRRTSSGAGRAEAANMERSRLQSTAAARGDASSKVLSGMPVSGAFYIYSFDGRLLAEYNISGQCVRNYIYFGGRLIAEYREYETGQYYYFTSDQINSTRVVTDSNGTVVYSAAHDPYGGIQKTWVNSYDPSLKFSGKQRDAESGLDYFGARYYDRSNYRFISVDPLLNRGAALHDSQRWNMYAYCRNNPIGFLDPAGKDMVRVWLDGMGYTYLDGIFSAKLESALAYCESLGIHVTFSGGQLCDAAYRTEEMQMKERAKNPNNAAMGIGQHQTATAVDINMNALQEAQRQILICAFKREGIVNNVKGEPWHFQYQGDTTKTIGSREGYSMYMYDEYLRLAGEEEFQALPWFIQSMICWTLTGSFII
jgi:RHS repeat-associated protein